MSGAGDDGEDDGESNSVRTHRPGRAYGEHASRDALNLGRHVLWFESVTMSVRNKSAWHDDMAEKPKNELPVRAFRHAPPSLRCAARGNGEAGCALESRPWSLGKANR